MVVICIPSWVSPAIKGVNTALPCFSRYTKYITNNIKQQPNTVKITVKAIKSADIV